MHLDRGRIATACLAVILSLPLLPQPASAVSFDVEGQANIFAAGRATAFNGKLPPGYRFAAAANRVLTFSRISGLLDCCGGTPATGPDGSTAGGSNINSYKGISGIRNDRRQMYLVGVFLDDAEPADPAPERLDFTNNMAFTTLAPKIRQTFFIGDGLTGTGTGSVQRFQAPATATRLYLGIADAWGFLGNPGYWDDNKGTLSATFELSGGAGGIISACTYTLDPPSLNFDYQGISGAIRVVTAAGCSWTAVSNTSWAKIYAGASGSGSTFVNFTTDPNTGASSRTGTLTIAGLTFTMTQGPWVPCTYTITPTSVSVEAAGRAGTVKLATRNDCTWTATSNVPWITLTTVSKGGFYVDYTVAANTAATSRTGTVTIAGQTFRVTQAAAACSYAISPATASVAAAAGAGSVQVTAASGCTWTASSSVPWIVIGSGASGSGNGSVAYTVAANTGTASRTGTVIIAGVTFRVTQAGAECSYVISPATASVAAAAGAGSVQVTTGTGCTWTASSSVPWIVIGSGASGSGNGSVAYTVAANTGTASRTGTVTIAGVTFRVTQAGAECSYVISPATASVAAAAGAGSVQVTAASGCTWTASSSVPWIVIGSGASGNGNGSVTYTVTANTGTASRTGTVTIAGLTFRVTQAAGPSSCTVSVSPASASIGADGGSGSVQVTAASGCVWSAASSVSWIGIASGASGSGNGSIGYTVAANTASSARTGVITVAGLSFTINQEAQGPQVPVVSRVGNAADGVPAFAPGSLISIVGTRLAGTSREASSPAPLELEGTSVEIVAGRSTLKAAVLRVSPEEVRAQLPLDLAAGPANLVVRTGRGASPAWELAIEAVNPRIFVQGGAAGGMAVASHAGGDPLTATAPAVAGETIAVLVTGLGAVTPAVPAGVPGGDDGSGGPVHLATASVTATLAAKSIPVVSAGLAPNKAGYYQVQLRVPEDLLGAAPLIIASEGRQSQAGVVLPVRNAPVLATAVLGAEGGTVEAAGFRAEFAPGALSTPQSITLSRAPSPPDSPSDTFILDNIPRFAKAPIAFQAPVNRPPEGDRIEIIVGWTQPDGSIRNQHIDAQVQGSVVAATLPPWPADPKPAAPSRATAQSAPSSPSTTATVRVAGFTTAPCNTASSLLMLVETEVAASVPPADVCRIQRLADLGKTEMETSIGLNWKGVTQYPMKWPLKYHVMRIYDYGYFEATGSAREGALGPGREQGVEINSLMFRMGPEGAMQLHAAGPHELFHVMQNKWDPRPDEEIATRPTGWLWFEEASSTWLESRAYEADGQRNMVPQAAAQFRNFFEAYSLDYWNVPWTSTGADTETNVGYGASLFARVLTDLHGPAFLRKVYAKWIWPGNLGSAAQAIDAALREESPASDLSSAWLTFLRRWMDGSIFGSAGGSYPPPGHIMNLDDPVDGSAFSARFPGTRRIALADTLQGRAWDAYDFSGAVFFVKPSASWTARTRLRFALLDESGGTPKNAELYVYHVAQPGHWRRLGVASGSGLTLDNAEALAAGNGMIYVMAAVGSNGYSLHDCRRLRLVVEPLKHSPRMEEIKKATRFSVTLQGEFNCTRCPSDYALGASNQVGDTLATIPEFDGNSLSAGRVWPGGNEYRLRLQFSEDGSQVLSGYFYRMTVTPYRHTTEEFTVSRPVPWEGSNEVSCGVHHRFTLMGESAVSAAVKFRWTQTDIVDGKPWATHEITSLKSGASMMPGLQISAYPVCK